MINVTQTVISQYGNSPTLLAMIDSVNAAIDPNADIDNFYRWIWSVDDAQGFGLDIWGRIVGVSRTVATTPATVLTDAQYRPLILLKAISNISLATAPAINLLLSTWMKGRGRTYVNDLGNMEIKYQFEFQLQPFEIEIIKTSGIFLRPAGVGATFESFTGPVFGFKGMTDAAAPFGQAPFVSG